jgi:hypothetical protein
MSILISLFEILKKINHSSLTPGGGKYSICMANAKIKKVNTSDFS